MSHTTSAPKSPRSARAWRLVLATVALALAAGFVQTAIAMPGQGGPGGPGMPMMGGPHMDRMLDGVGATADQKAQLRQIMDAARTDLRALRDSQRKLHEQARALFLQPTVDASAAEALRQQMMAGHEQASKRMMQAMLDASRVLTPDQRKQMADRAEQRRSMMLRHRSERETLDGAPRRP